MSLATINRSLGKETPRLIELGKIKIGGLGGDAEAKSGSTYRKPVKYDHFVITTMHRAEGRGDGDLIMDMGLMKELQSKYAGKPTKQSKPGLDFVLREIPIWLPTNDINDALQVSWVWYKGRTVLGARSDGDKVTWYCSGRTGEMLPEPVVTDWKPEFEHYTFDKKPMFKLNTVFNCLIASSEAKFGGVYTFRSTSKITYEQLYSSLTTITSLTKGVLRNMPLVMAIKPLKVKTGTVYVVHVELRGSDIQAIQQKALEERRWEIEHKQESEQLQQQYKLLLAPPGTEKGQAMRDVVDEFYPEVTPAIKPAPDHIDFIDGPAPASKPADGEPKPNRKAAKRGAADAKSETPPETTPESRHDESDVADEGEHLPLDLDPDVVDAHYSAESITSPPARPSGEQVEYADHIDDAAEYEAYLASQKKSGGTAVLDEIGIEEPPPKPKPVPPTPAEQKLLDAALAHEPKPVSVTSTVDEFLSFIVQNRPDVVAGRKAEPMTAYEFARRKLAVFLPKAWEKLTAAQRSEAIAKVRAGKFPWPMAASK